MHLMEVEHVILFLDCLRHTERRLICILSDGYLNVDELSWIFMAPFFLGQSFEFHALLEG